MVYINKFYIDESGSMTKIRLDKINHKYFVVCIVLVNDSKKLKRIFKRYISANIERLRKNDKDNKMFYKNGKFKEIKGSSLNKEMKNHFINYFCQNNYFKIFYILCENYNVNSFFYDNTARAFNYVIKNSLESFTKNRLIKKDDNFLNVDERNVKTNSRSTLQEYLNIELYLSLEIQKTFQVLYCQSESNILIQIADFFSNLYYSNLITNGKYNEEIKMLFKKGYIKDIFKFPIKKS